VGTSPIFIIGAQRSGTTLLRMILNTHSQIAFPGEGTFFMPLLKKRYLKKVISGAALKNLINYLALDPQLQSWGYNYSDYFSRLSRRGGITVRELMADMHSLYSEGKGKIIWGDKSPSFFRKIDILFSLFPDARFIHIVRDGRDIFHSWRKLDPSKDNAPIVAIDWSYKLFKVERSFRKIPPQQAMTIRYEDLLDDPEGTTKSICNFLKVEYQTTMLEFHRTSHDYVGTHHSKLIFTPIDKNNKYKWKKNLPSREIEGFTVLARHHLHKYHYETNSKLKKASTVFHIIKDVGIGLPKRMMQVWQAKKAYSVAMKKGMVSSVPVGKLPRGVQRKQPTG
jgi:hypothetical protein